MVLVVRMFKVMDTILQTIDVLLQNLDNSGFPAIYVFAVLLYIQASALAARKISVTLLVFHECANM